MKITDIVVHRLSVPLPRPVRTARHNHAHADTVAVEMRADSGLVGSGYCFAFGRRKAASTAAIRNVALRDVSYGKGGGP